MNLYIVERVGGLMNQYNMHIVRAPSEQDARMIVAINADGELGSLDWFEPEKTVVTQIDTQLEQTGIVSSHEFATYY